MAEGGRKGDGGKGDWGCSVGLEALEGRSPYHPWMRGVGCVWTDRPARAQSDRPRSNWVTSLLVCVCSLLIQHE